MEVALLPLGRATVQLTENDYAVDETNPVLPVLVTTQGIHSGNITLQIIPLTFDMYRTEYPDQPCARSVEVLINGVNEAESKKDNLTVFNGRGLQLIAWERFWGTNCPPKYRETMTFLSYSSNS